MFSNKVKQENLLLSQVVKLTKVLVIQSPNS